MLAVPWGQSKTLYLCPLQFHPHPFTHLLPNSHPRSTPSKRPAHRPQGAGPGSPVSHLEGEEGALGRETSPSMTSSTGTGPGEILQGVNRPPARTRRTHRAIPRFAPSWQPPSRNRCQAAKATCSWGRARATLSAAEEKPGNQDGGSIRR